MKKLLFIVLPILAVVLMSGECVSSNNADTRDRISIDEKGDTTTVVVHEMETSYYKYDTLNGTSWGGRQYLILDEKVGVCDWAVLIGDDGPLNMYHKPDCESCRSHEAFVKEQDHNIIEARGKENSYDYNFDLD